MFKLVNLILLSNLIFLNSAAAANKDNFPKVGDYLIAEISSQESDYEIANRHYLRLIKKDKNRRII